MSEFIVTWNTSEYVRRIVVEATNETHAILQVVGDQYGKLSTVRIKSLTCEPCQILTLEPKP